MDKESVATSMSCRYVHGFNPCFNGFMDKEYIVNPSIPTHFIVSILVLMDSWIKSPEIIDALVEQMKFQSLF